MGAVEPRSRASFTGVFLHLNESVFTALNASFTSLQGWTKSTRTLDAMKEGVNRSLETIAEVGGKG
ncbi:MAG: hypothetical protein U5R30_10475 [Deltaproteobacteria bacterium]|nr:hypothetical protein [Deltaproteobacteria bacterium]